MSFSVPVCFSLKRSKSNRGVKRKENPVDNVFFSEADEEAPRSSSEPFVIPKQENSFRSGSKNAFVPRFVPHSCHTKEELESNERFEAAEIKETKQNVQYGLQPRHGVGIESFSSEFVSSSKKTEEEELESFRREVDALPDEADAVAYNRMPVEAFGLAMLKGMDWKEGQVLGKNKDKKAVEAVEYVPRASRLGLGAAPNAKRQKGPVMVLPKGKDGKIRHVRALDEKLVPFEDPGVKRDQETKTDPAKTGN